MTKLTFYTTEKTLLLKYPKIFRQKDLPMSETCMCWGIECGRGWYHLIDNLCYHLQQLTDNDGHPQIEFVQVKEKFGSLRIYVNEASEMQHLLIEFVENLSCTVCENCGKPGNIIDNGHYWIKTLCDDCMEKIN